MDLERTMAYIVEQQAKFETDIATINESIRGLVEASRLQGQRTEELVVVSRLQAEVSRMQSERMDRLEQDLAKGFATMVDAHNRLADRLDRAALAGEETDRRLSDFIAQVSRYLSGGDGHQRGSGSPETK